MARSAREAEGEVPDAEALVSAWLKVLDPYGMYAEASPSRSKRPQLMRKGSNIVMSPKGEKQVVDETTGERQTADFDLSTWSSYMYIMLYYMLYISLYMYTHVYIS